MSYPPPPGTGAPGGYPPQGGGFPPQGGGYPPPPQGGFAAPQNQTNGLAIAALITGIISIVTCIFPLGLVAAVLGFVALGKAKNLNGSGKGMAIGGIVTGIIGLISGAALLFLVFLAGDAANDQIDDAVCSADRITLEAAVSSYQIGEQADPSSQDDLIREGYLTEEIPEYDFSISNGEVSTSAVSGEGCD